MAKNQRSWTCVTRTKKILNLLPFHKLRQELANSNITKEALNCLFIAVDGVVDEISFLLFCDPNKFSPRPSPASAGVKIAKSGTTPFSTRKFVTFRSLSYEFRILPGLLQATLSTLLTYCVLRPTQPPTIGGREMRSSSWAKGEGLVLLIGTVMCPHAEPQVLFASACNGWPHYELRIPFARAYQLLFSRL